MNTKILVGAYVLLLVIGVAGLFFPKSTNTSTTQFVAGTSPSGTTFNTAKSALISWTPNSNTASSTSILNSDASDRIIKDILIDCVGTNFTASNPVSSLLFQAATTSVANTGGIQQNTNLALYQSIATSSNWSYVSSSTQQNTVQEVRRWAAGSYLTFVTNATSTGLACTVGASYMGT